MKTPVLSYILCHSLVLARPQNNVGSFSTFSNFNPQSQTFTAGTNTRLSQTFSTGQDTFFQSLDSGLDSLFPTGFDGLANTGFNTNDFLEPSLPQDASFNLFSFSTGGCDSFCQNAKRLEDQSFNQFEKDLKNFQAQFGNTQSNLIPQNRKTSTNVFGQDVTNKRPTITDQFRPNSFDNRKPGTSVSKPTFTRKAITTQRPRVTPFTIFNRPSSTTTTRPRPRTTRRQTMPTTTTSTKEESIPIKSTPIPISSTSEKENNKNSKTLDTKTSFSIPMEITTQKNTKIRFTFNGKRIRNSKTTTKRSMENVVEELPISTFFNGDDENNDRTSKERNDQTMAYNNESAFPVFDAVPK